MVWRWNRLFLIVWAALLLYSILFAPGDLQGSMELAGDVITDPFGMEPLLFMVFNIMGIWPMVYAGVLLFEDNKGKLPSWPFVIASFFSGAFSLLLYAGLRRPMRDRTRDSGILLRILDSRIYALFLKIAAVLLLAYGIGMGDPSEYLDLFSSSSLVHIMTLDLLALTILSPFFMRDDMRRRGWGGRKIFWVYALVPLLGPISYLLTRPRVISK
ncbi:MAG: DUF2834 domain-containing protein [Thermoplasmatota archaeon]